MTMNRTERNFGLFLKTAGTTVCIDSELASGSASVTADHDQLRGPGHWAPAAPPRATEAAPPRQRRRSLVGP